MQSVAEKVLDAYPAHYVEPNWRLVYNVRTESGWLQVQDIKMPLYVQRLLDYMPGDIAVHCPTYIVGNKLIEMEKRRMT